MDIEQARERGAEAAKALAAARGALVTAIQTMEDACEAFGAVWPEVGTAEYGEARIASARWSERLNDLREANKRIN